MAVSHAVKALQMGGRLRLGADAGVEVGGLVHCADAGQLLRAKPKTDGLAMAAARGDIAAGLSMICSSCRRISTSAVCSRSPPARPRRRAMPRFCSAAWYTPAVMPGERMRMTHQTRGRSAPFSVTNAAVQKLRDARGDESRPPPVLCR